MSLQQRRILLGISGGIAAYKACELVRRLRDQGAEVQVVMTEAATHFVTPTTFQALSGRPVRVDVWDTAGEAAMGHIELARWAERLLIAPASADLIGRLAHGLAGDLLTTLALATAAPLLIAPAMNQQMWAHPAVQANLAILQRRGVSVLGPAAGEQACGDVGSGRMLEALQLRDAVAASFGSDELRGLRVLVSAGPTYEDLDPVRFIGNRSSGKMGFAIAAAAVRAGAEVTLVAGPVHLATPAGVARRIDVRSTMQMQAAIYAEAARADIFVSAAAVGDYRPQEVAPHKIKKQAGEALSLALQENPDIIAGLGRQRQHPFLVGFAAETRDVARYARDKLARKGLDMIAANRVGEGLGFDMADNALSLFWADGGLDLPQGPKCELAWQLVQQIAHRYRLTRATGAVAVDSPA